MLSLLKTLESKGVNVYLVGEKLKFDVRKGIDREIAELILKNKPVIIAELKGENVPIDYLQTPGRFYPANAQYEKVKDFLTIVMIDWGYRFYLDDEGICQLYRLPEYFGKLPADDIDAISDLCEFHGVMVATAKIGRTENADGIKFEAIYWDEPARELPPMDKRFALLKAGKIVAYAMRAQELQDEAAARFGVEKNRYAFAKARIEIIGNPDYAPMTNAEKGIVID